MGVCYSSNPKAKDHYNLAPFSSQAETSDYGHQHPRLSLDPSVIEIEISDTGDSGKSIELNSETVPIRRAEKKVPSSPFVPKHLLEGRSFLQSPLGKKKVPLREFCDSPTRNRLSGRQFNDVDTVKTRIFRD